MNNLTKEQIEKLALKVALRFHLSDFDYDKKASDTLTGIGTDEDIVVWEPFERMSTSDLHDSIWNLSNDIQTTMSKALGLPKDLGENELTTDQWEEKYKPIINTIGDNASWQNGEGEGIMFETYDAELDFVSQQPDNNVWTWVDGDGGTFIVTGMAYVNRIGYFVTTEPWETHVEVQVDNYSDDDMDDDDDNMDETD